MILRVNICILVLYCVYNFMYFRMSRCVTNVKRFISCKRSSLLFCGADNNSRPCDNCVLIVANWAWNVIAFAWGCCYLLNFFLASAWIVVASTWSCCYLLNFFSIREADCVSPPFLSSLPDENDGITYRIMSILCCMYNRRDCVLSDFNVNMLD